jgi:hypothetical protein
MKSPFLNTPFSGLLACLIVIGAPSLAKAYEPNATVTTAATQSGNDPIAHYRAYEAAIAAGDVNGAQVAAMSAWQTGEQVWAGNNPNLPGLAYNAAWSLGLAGKIADAREPARRAVELAGQYPDKVNMREAAFLDAYARLVNTPTKSSLDRFQTAAANVSNGGWSDYLLPIAYVDAAKIAISVDAPRLGRDLVDLGLREAQQLAPNDNNLRTNLMVLRTQSSLKLRLFGQAVNEAMEARRAYGPQKQQRDANWAMLAAWESASRAVYQSIYNDGPATGSRIRSREQTANNWETDEYKKLTASPIPCDNEGIKRRGPGGPVGISFPIAESNDGMVGGATVRASLDPQGNVIETDILASLPRPSFGTAAATGIAGWKYDVPSDVTSQCRFVDVQLIYAFVR